MLHKFIDRKYIFTHRLIPSSKSRFSVLACSGHIEKCYRHGGLNQRNARSPDSRNQISECKYQHGWILDMRLFFLIHTSLLPCCHTNFILWIFEIISFSIFLYWGVVWVFAHVSCFLHCKKRWVKWRVRVEARGQPWVSSSFAFQLMTEPSACCFD